MEAHCCFVRPTSGLNLLSRLAECFMDGRNQDLVEHTIAEMLAQRIYGLALGYEDINDHEQLRKDPVFSILAGRENLDEPLAGKSTLNRMEPGGGTSNRYKKITFWKDAVDELMVKVFIEPHHSASARSQSRCGLRQPERNTKNRDAASDGVAGSENGAARRLRFLPQPADELLRKQRSGFHIWHGAQSETAEDHRERKCMRRPASGFRPASRRGYLPSSANRQKGQRRAGGIASGGW